MEKRLLILGGSRFIIPVIQAAHELGHYVIPMDYLPDNIAHSFSDEYVNVSIVDKEAVCAAAEKLRVDGITSFAADPGVISAAYTAEQLGLPFQGSFRAVEILQKKDLFRAFLAEHGFNCPQFFMFRSADEALERANDFPYPVIVKPTDSAGSKGCTRVDCASELAAAVEYALPFSQDGSCIIEQFLEKLYPSSSADCFSVNGKIVCLPFTTQPFDKNAANPYTPAGSEMPSSIPEEYLAQLRGELQRLFDLLELRTGVYNIETRVATDGLPYIMEVSPRGGGNRLCELLRYASGVDLIRASVQSALGEDVQDVHDPVIDGYWHESVLHSAHGGVFAGMWYAPGFKEAHVVNEQLWVEPGDVVEGFSAANQAFGTIVLRFDTKEELATFNAAEDQFMHAIID